MFQMLSAIEGVVTRPGLDISLSQAIEPLIGFTLPNDHLGLLRQTNGAEGFGGYVRLFGFGPAFAIDLVQWNAENFWKFAWSGQVTPYFCFAETGWGISSLIGSTSLKWATPAFIILKHWPCSLRKLPLTSVAFLPVNFCKVAICPMTA